MSQDVGALLLAIGSGLAIIVRIGLGRYVDRVRSDAGGELAVIFAGGAMAFVAVALGMNNTFLFVFGVVAAMATGWGWPGLFYHHVASRFVSNVAHANGVAMSSAFFGMLVGPLIIGGLAQSLSYTWAWIFASGALAVAGGLIIALRAAPRT